MARITVEDCLKKTDSQYDLVLLAKERTSQLNAGDAALVSEDNDKNTVIALREIGEGKISIKTLTESAVNKLRKHQNETVESEEVDDEHEDDFDKMYKGEISKSGTAILPSKRTKRFTDNINKDYKNLKDKNKDKIEDSKQQEEPGSLPTDDISQQEPKSPPTDDTSKE